MNFYAIRINCMFRLGLTRSPPRWGDSTIRVPRHPRCPRESLIWVQKRKAKPLQVTSCIKKYRSQSTILRVLIGRIWQSRVRESCSPSPYLTTLKCTFWVRSCSWIEWGRQRGKNRRSNYARKTCNKSNRKEPKDKQPISPLSKTNFRNKWQPNSVMISN